MKRIFVQSKRPLTEGTLAPGEGWCFRDLSFSPSLGMNILSLTAEKDGKICDVLLRPELTKLSSTDPFYSFKMGSAFLIPFANRISNEHILFDGQTVSLDRVWSDPGHPNQKAIHGLYYNREVAEFSVHDGVVRGYDVFQSEKWFSSFDVNWQFHFTVKTLTIDIKIKNLGPSKMPIGLGWHPYFLVPSRKRENIRIQLPGVPAYAGPRALDERNIDEPFLSAEPSTFVVSDVGSDFKLQGRCSNNLNVFHLFSPKETDFVCLEPQTHMPEPFLGQGAEFGLRIMAPNEVAKFSITLVI